MTTTVEKLENNQVKISFEIPASDVDARIKRTYKEFAKRYKHMFPGFRPGKAPRRVIDSFLGADAVRAAVTEDLVNDVYPKALNENNIAPLFQADMDYATDMVEDGKDFAFTATVSVAPEVELTSYDPCEIEIPSTEATEEEVDRQVEELREYYVDFENANANTKVKATEVIEYSATVTGDNADDAEKLCADHRLYELGKNLLPAAFDAELIGLKRGESKSFDVDFAGSDAMIAYTLADKGVYHFDVTVNSIKRKVLPEVTDEWVTESFGLESVEAMKKSIAEQIKSEKEYGKHRRIENECLMTLANRVEEDAPEAMCEIQEEALLRDFFTQLQQNQLSHDQYLEAMGLTAEQFKEDVKKQAADMVKQELALNAWARHAGLEVTAEEISAEFDAQVENSREVEAQWVESGRIPVLRESILRNKALIRVCEEAKVTEVPAEDAK